MSGAAGTETGLQSSWPGEPAGKPPEKRSKLAIFRELPVLIVIAFVLALLMKTFLVQAFYIPSESMEPTLHGCTGCNGDRVLVNKLAWRLRAPARGEIKRIIGLPGETVQVTDKGVYITPVHGKRFKLFEPYIARPSNNGTLVPCGRSRSCPEGKTQAPIKVPPDSYFVMGDNRENSADSRFRNPPWIKRSDLVGKAFVKIWPIGRIGIVHLPAYAAKGAAAPGASQPAPVLPIGAVALGLGAIIRRQPS
ncbi:MAG: signal peptidase I [Actinobacteria bacterium]|nr:MAG: signal peptidase I [Actinomycetota bacterium]